MGRLVMTPRRSNVLGTSFCDRGLPFMLLFSMRSANVLHSPTAIPERFCPVLQAGNVASFPQPGLTVW
jgi:hypothetical protein